METTITMHENGETIEKTIYSLMDLYYTLAEEFFHYDIQTIALEKGFIFIEGCDHVEGGDKLAYMQASKREYEYIKLLLPLKKSRMPKRYGSELVLNTYSIGS